MPQEDIIAMRYAKGLAEAGLAAGSMDEIRRDLDLLVDLFSEKNGKPSSPEFERLLESPSVPAEEKCRVTELIVRKCGIGRTVEDFLTVLIRHGRTGLLFRIYAAFSEAADAMTGERTAVVRTAMPLSEDQERRLTQALSASTGAKVWLRQIVQPELLAGAIVSIGSHSLDGTVRGKLERLGHELEARICSGMAEDEETENDPLSGPGTKET